MGSAAFASSSPTHPPYSPFIFLISPAIAADLESTLDARRFIRIHRATIVNIAAVHEIDRWIDGGLLVRLKDDKRTELPVARDRVRELKRRLGV